jgi:hypothetical protein
MPTKTGKDPRVQQDRHHQPAGRDTDQPRSFDASARRHDANADTSPRPEPDEDINIHGSER